MIPFVVIVVKKLECAVLKFYVINAVSNNKVDKVNDFLNKMTNEIQGQPEWKDWYGTYAITYCIDQINAVSIKFP